MVESVAQRRAYIVAARSVKIENLVECYCVALFNGERMLAPLSLQQRALAVILRMHEAFQQERIRMAFNFIRQPAEPRPKTSLIFARKMFNVEVEILF